MKTIRSIPQMQKLARAMTAQNMTIALVPTMGFLHDGHLSLIRRARKLADVVVTSVFVNPIQFGPKDDFKAYPRNEKKDIKAIASAGGDIVFVPRAELVYPVDFQTFVTVEKITATLEGEFRPTHFIGVTTVVAKLFNVVRPDLAVFGMKDYQQVMVIQQMISDLNYPIKLIVAPTVREKDGLAMSSRNSYFTPRQRPKAICLYAALKQARAMVLRDGVDKPAVLKRKMTQVILSICPTAQIDYIAFTDFDSLQPVKRITRNTICSLAVRVHGVRLIDNMKLS
ncbi:MAG: pantoate--beta-alanine ligase [candidate division Zixibacteria bacterium]|nr:pantoate--beta-alanine ligase [candidate division Zixibacteria bacterium]